MDRLKIIFFPLTMIIFPFQLSFSIFQSILFSILRLIGIRVTSTIESAPLAYVNHRFNKDIDEDGVLLEIEGRQQGWMAYVMQLLKVNNQSFIRVTTEEVRISTIAAFSKSHHITPLSAITTTHYQVTKPKLYAYTGIFLLLAGIWNIILPLFNFGKFPEASDILDNSVVTNSGLPWWMKIGMILVALLFLFWYYMATTMTIAFSTDSISAIKGITFFNDHDSGSDSDHIQYDELVEIFEYIDLNVIKAHEVTEPGDTNG